MPVEPARVCADEGWSYAPVVPAATPQPAPDSIPMRPRDTRFNTPAEMLVRLVFASRYILLLAGLATAVSALHHGSVADALKSLFFFAAMVGGHLWLKARGKIAECDRALDAMFRGDDLADDEGGLHVLLRRRDALEEKRGTPGFDPWEVQVLRREISDYVRTHPGSSGLGDGRR